MVFGQQIMKMIMKAVIISNNYVKREWRQQHHQFKKKRKGIEDFMNCDLKFLFFKWFE